MREGQGERLTWAVAGLRACAAGGPHSAKASRYNAVEDTSDHACDRGLDRALTSERADSVRSRRERGVASRSVRAIRGVRWTRGVCPRVYGSL